MKENYIVHLHINKYTFRVTVSRIHRTACFPFYLFTVLLTSTKHRFQCVHTRLYIETDCVLYKHAYGIRTSYDLFRAISYQPTLQWHEHEQCALLSFKDRQKNNLNSTEYIAYVHIYICTVGNSSGSPIILNCLLLSPLARTHSYFLFLFRQNWIVDETIFAAFFLRSI